MPESVASPPSPPKGAHPSAISFSTNQFNERERIAAWREFIGRMFCKVNIEPHSRERFASAAKLRMLPGLALVSGNCSPLSYVQTPSLIENDDIILTIATRPWVLKLDGREVAFGAGESTITSAASRGTYSLTSGGRHWGVRVPSALLSPLVNNIEDAFGRRIRAGDPAMQLLTSYLSVIRDVADADLPELKQRAVTHIHDLLALVIGANRDAADIARGRGVPAARLDAIKDDIAIMLHQDDLSVAAIAARHRCTPRSVQRLFETEGMTFSEYVLTQRLARARELLTDPQHAGAKINSIAFDAGFRDPSYFHRSFRRRYGESPSDVREETRCRVA